MKKYSTFFLIFLSLNLYGQSVQKKNWEYSKVVYNSKIKNDIIITNSLPKGGGIVFHKEKSTIISFFGLMYVMKHHRRWI